MGEQGHAKTGGERSATPRLAQGWAGREAADRPLCSARSLCTGLQLFPTPLCLLLPAPCEVVKATRGSMQPTPPPTQVSPSPHRCCFAGRAARAGWPRHGHGLLSARKAVLFHACMEERKSAGRHGRWSGMLSAENAGAGPFRTRFWPTVAWLCHSALTLGGGARMLCNEAWLTQVGDERQTRLGTHGDFSAPLTMMLAMCRGQMRCEMDRLH